MFFDDWGKHAIMVQLGSFFFGIEEWLAHAQTALHSLHHREMAPSSPLDSSQHWACHQTGNALRTTDTGVPSVPTAIVGNPLRWPVHAFRVSRPMISACGDTHGYLGTT